jgi:hypothetical protein
MAGIFDSFWSELQLEIAGNDGITPLTSKIGQYGTLNALMSRENVERSFLNRHGNSVIINSNPSAEFSTFQYKYQKRRVGADIGNGATNYCTDAAKVPEWVQGTQTFSYKTSFREKIDLADLKKVGQYNGGRYESYMSWFSELARLNFNPFLQEINGEAVDFLIANKGINKTNGIQTPVPLQGFSNLASYTVNPAFEIGVTTEFENQQYYDDIILVGDGLFKPWYRRTRSSDVTFDGSRSTDPTNPYADNDGYAGGMYTGRMAFFGDSTIDAKVIANNDNVLAWQPGTFVMLPVLRFKDHEEQMGDHIQTTMVFDMGGLQIPCDVVFSYEKCVSGAMGWFMTVEFQYDFFVYDKDNQYDATDELYQTNSIANFQLTAV